MSTTRSPRTDSPHAEITPLEGDTVARVSRRLHAADHRAVPRGLRRPLQHLGRVVDHERRHRAHRDRVRARRRPVLRHVHPGRGPEQRRPRTLRRPSLDGTHHDHLGHRRRLHVARRRLQVLRPRASAARGGGGGLHAGHHLLPLALVPRAAPGPGHGAVLRRLGPGHDDRRPDQRSVPQARRPRRARGLEVALRPRGHPRRRARLRRPRSTSRTHPRTRRGCRPRTAPG